MNKWMLSILATSTAVTMAGCAGGGGSGSGLVGSSCSATGTKSLSTSSVDSNDTQAATQPMASPLMENADPFELNGKVQIASFNTMNAYSTSAADATLAAGTNLTVTVRDACQNPGAIAKAIVTENGEELPTPAGVRSYRWALPQDMTIDQLTAEADADACVTGVTELGTMEVSEDPRVAEQGHLAMLEAKAATSIASMATQGPTVTIAVIDTGIDTDHEDLKNVMWVNNDEIPGNGVDDDKNGYVDDVNGYNFPQKKPSPKYGGTWSGYHHGTHVAGLAAAQDGNGAGGAGTAGTRARIMGLNVFGADSGAFSSDVANAIRYAADNGADVINMSVGGVGRNASYEAALAYAIRKGATIFAAAGNERRELGDGYSLSPAIFGKQFAGAVSVGSADSKDLVWSTFSNFSPTFVEIAAPGSEDSSEREGVLSTYPNNKYMRIQGTSMATPVAAGGAALAIAMLRDRGYTPSPATIEGLMAASSRNIENLRQKVRDGRVMNLKLMAEFINKNYPKRSGGGDPGVPGHNACALGTSL